MQVYRCTGRLWSPALRRVLLCACAMALFGWSGGAALAQPPLPTVTLQLGDHTVVAELADTPSRMRDGLMFRTHLAQDSGMLFLLGPPADLYCFWMKNTVLPLSIAFIDTGGHIVSIQTMQPQSLEPHCAPSLVLSALEMNQGWFERAGVRVGDVIRGIPEKRDAAASR